MVGRVDRFARFEVPIAVSRSPAPTTNAHCSPARPGCMLPSVKDTVSPANRAYRGTRTEVRACTSGRDAHGPPTLTSPGHTPRFCQSSQARLVNLSCTSIARRQQLSLHSAAPWALQFHGPDYTITGCDCGNPSRLGRTPPVALSTLRRSAGCSPPTCRSGPVCLRINASHSHVPQMRRNDLHATSGTHVPARATGWPIGRRANSLVLQSL